MAVARSSDPSTSHDAAGSLSEARIRDSQFSVYILIDHHGAAGLSDQDLIRAYASAHLRNPTMYPYQSESGLRTRRSELVRKGLVVDSGRRSTTRSGRKAIVWMTKKMASGKG
jgi:hypothetical protein